MPDTYTTRQGDVWDAIAKDLWGEETFLHHLVQANPEYQDVVVFSAGVVLTVPDVSVTAVNSALPPWRTS